MGDYNLNYLRWDITPNLMNSYDRQKKTLIDMFKNKILDKGHIILSKTPTKLSDDPQSEDSCLDLMVTNRPQKIAYFQAGIPTFSDHCMQILVRKTKEIKTNKKIIRTRCFKNFNQNVYKNNIMNHPNFVEVLYERDPDTLTSKIQEMIQDSLFEMAPVKKIQISEKNSVKLSENTREKMVARDLAFFEYKKNKKIEDLRFYRNLKNEVNNHISKEKFARKVEFFKSEDTKMNQKWQKMKKITGQSNFLSPQLLTENGVKKTAPLEIAQSLNRQFISKVRKIKNEIKND